MSKPSDTFAPVSATAPKPGELIASKYRLEKQLGRGGMGVVFLATDTDLERRVAVKLLLEEHAEDQAAVLRFLREAKASAKIQSEHVARVYETGRLESGVPYIVMEYLQGEDLAALLEASGPLEADQIAQWILQVCEALAEAHAAGIVHRDLKPANLFLAQRPDGDSVLKILDFGISKISTSSVLTKSQTLVGSPYYMSPEQLESAQDVDQRADIWALGVIMYELYSGKRPFEGDSLAALCVSVLNATPEPLLAAGDEAFGEVAIKCLQKDRQQRYQNVGELAAALESLRPQHSQGAAARVTKVLQNAQTVPDLPRRESDTAPDRSASSAQTNREITAQQRTKRRFVLAVVVLAAAAFVGIGLGRLVRTPSPDATALDNSPTAFDKSPIAEPSPSARRAPPASKPTEPRSTTEVVPAPADSLAGSESSVDASGAQMRSAGEQAKQVPGATRPPRVAVPARAPVARPEPAPKALAPSTASKSKVADDPARDPFLRRY